MKTIIAGSRTATDYKHLILAIDYARLEGIEVTEVVSGTARGADQLGERYAEEVDMPLHKFPADWDKNGKRAGYLRNVEMAENAEALIALWDGESRGTKHMIDIAKLRGLKVYVHQC